MDEINLESHPAPTTRDVPGGLRRLRRLLGELGMPLEGVLDIAVSRAVAKERLMSRRREGETEATIEARLADFEVTTYPVIAHYESLGLLRRVDGEGSPEEVIQIALKAVGL